MATKQELETENEELKKKLAELEPLKTADNETFLTEIVNLKSGLLELQEQNEEGLKELEEFSANLAVEKKLHQEALADARAWKKKYDEKPKLADVPVPASHEVVWKGETFKVVHVNSVRELKEDMQKRFVAAELTAIVIDVLH